MPELTPATLARRRNGLGGSDAPSVFGHGFNDPFTVWVDKLWGTPNRPTARMQRGHDLEPLIAEKAAVRLGLRDLQPAGWVDHPQHNWMFANLDYTAEGGGVIVECKAIEHRDKGHEWGADGDPDGCALHVELQAMHQIEVHAPELLVVAVMFVDTWELRTYPIKPDRDLQGRMVEGEHRFWVDHVVAQVPPPITDTVSAWDAIRSVDARPDSSTDLGDGTAELIGRYLDARQQRLDAEKHEMALKAELARLMVDHEHGFVDGELAVTFKQPSTGEGSRRLIIPTPYRKEHHGNT